MLLRGSPLHIGPSGALQQLLRHAITSRRGNARIPAVAALNEAASTAEAPVDRPLPAWVTAVQRKQLELYLDHMLEVNQVMNLTAVRDPVEAWHRHVGDSLVLLPVLDQHLQQQQQQQERQRRASVSVASSSGAFDHPGKGSSQQRRQKQRQQQPQQQPQRSSRDEPSVALADWQLEFNRVPQQPHPQSPSGQQLGASGQAGAGAGSSEAAVAPADQPLRVIDVGTGAGLPGMVLAIARPNWRVTLLDSLRKRCDFLEGVVQLCGIENVDVVWSRAEDGGRSVLHREAYDVAVARAVAETRVLAELCLPFVRPGGLWVAPKGPNPEEEVAASQPALRTLGGHLLAVERVDSFNAEGQRTALVVAKAAATPAKYPRPAGTPGKKPL